MIDIDDGIDDDIDDGMNTVGIFMDLSKAFDTIDHGILLEKLYHYGFRGGGTYWFKSYFTK